MSLEAKPDTIQIAGIQTLRREVAAARLLSFRLWTYLRLLPFLLALFTNAPVSSKEAVIFEQIGQLAGVTAYLHVHIELSITSVEQQLSKYRQASHNQARHRREHPRLHAEPVQP
jgi:hypothetical protein